MGVLENCPKCKFPNYRRATTCYACGAPMFNASEAEAAEPTAGAVGVRSSAVVRPPSSGGQPERETGGQLRIRPPSPGHGEGESEAISRASESCSRRGPSVLASNIARMLVTEGNILTESEWAWRVEELILEANEDTEANLIR